MAFASTELEPYGYLCSTGQLTTTQVPNDFPVKCEQIISSGVCDPLEVVMPQKGDLTKTCMSASA